VSTSPGPSDELDPPIGATPPDPVYPAAPADESVRGPARSGGLGAVVRGFAALGVATVVGQAIGFAALVVVARRVGPENLGAYTFAQNLVQYLPIDVGVSVYAVREIVREPERFRRIVGEVLALRTVVMVLCVAATLALAPYVLPDENVREVLPAVLAALVPLALTTAFALQARGSLVALGGLLVLGQILYGALIPILVGHGLSGVKTYAWLNVFSMSVPAVGTGIVVWRRWGAPRLVVAPRALIQRFRRSLSMGIALLLIFLYFNIDALMLGWLRGPLEVGLYGVAYKIPANLVTLAGLWVVAFYPHASAMFVSEPERLRAQIGRVTTIAAILGLPLAVGGILLASPLMTAVFGDAYRGGVSAFALLLCSTALVFVTSSFGNALLAGDDERAYASRVALGALFNISLNLVLIPAMGVTGAAISTVTAEVFLLSALARRVRRRLGPVPIEWARIARAAGAVAVMSAVVLAVRSAGVWTAVALGAAVYGVTALATGAITRDELRALVRRRPLA
jgi:O-antigen/teichoic acid export membrane protein